MKFPSRRSVVHSTKGMVACTQPLAAKCGIDILNAGGNAAVRLLSFLPKAHANIWLGRRRGCWYVPILTTTVMKLIRQPPAST